MGKSVPGKPNVFMIPMNHVYIRKMRAELEALGVGVKVLRPFHWATPYNLWSILSLMRKGYNTVHIHWLWVFPLGLMMKCFWLLCNKAGMKIVWEMHNILPHGYSERDRYLAKWFYTKADAVIFHSRDDISRCKKVFQTEITRPHIVIPHGDFNDSYVNNISKFQARAKLGIAAGMKVILCFGFIRENRGYQYLIEATKEMKDVLLVIAGKIWDKPVYHQLQEERRANSKIMLYGGWIPDDQVQIYFNSCDVVVLPYTDITTSGVIPLAYSFRRPVIVSSIGGIRDVVNQDTGILVPPRDARALRGAIQEIFMKDLVRMGNDAHAYAEREFGWASIAIKVKGLYESLTRGSEDRDIKPSDS